MLESHSGRGIVVWLYKALILCAKISFAAGLLGLGQVCCINRNLGCLRNVIGCFTC